MTKLLALSLVLAAPALAQGVPLDPEPGPAPEAETPAPAPRPTPVPTAAPRPSPAPVVARAEPRVRGPRRLSGVRTGVTILSQGTIDRINEAFDDCFFDDQRDCGEDRISGEIPVVTQFGWQYENRIFQSETGLTGLTEWVLLVGGVERGLFLPSLTFLAGLRAPGGLEVGVGPNLSLGGAAYAVSVGHSYSSGDVNLPVNLALVFGQDGPRASVLVGSTSPTAAGERVQRVQRVQRET